MSSPTIRPRTSSSTGSTPATGTATAPRRSSNSWRPPRAARRYRRRSSAATRPSASGWCPATENSAARDAPTAASITPPRVQLAELLPRRHRLTGAQNPRISTLRRTSGRCVTRSRSGGHPGAPVALPTHNAEAWVAPTVIHVSTLELPIGDVVSPTTVRTRSTPTDASGRERPRVAPSPLYGATAAWTYRSATGRHSSTSGKSFTGSIPEEWADWLDDATTDPRYSDDEVTSLAAELPTEWDSTGGDPDSGGGIWTASDCKRCRRTRKVLIRSSCHPVMEPLWLAAGGAALAVGLALALRLPAAHPAVRRNAPTRPHRSENRRSNSGRPTSWHHRIQRQCIRRPRLLGEEIRRRRPVLRRRAVVGVTGDVIRATVLSFNRGHTSADARFVERA